MIFDRIENASMYLPLGPRLATAMRYLSRVDVTKLPDGRQDMWRDELYALIQRYQTKPASEGKFEAHRRYIDVQYVAEGRERIGFAHTAEMTVTQEYDPEADCLLVDGPGEFVTLSAGCFVVLMPYDAHMPGIALDAPAPVTKIVVKVMVD